MQLAFSFVTFCLIAFRTPFRIYDFCVLPGCKRLMIIKHDIYCIYFICEFFQKLCVSMYFEMILFNFIRKGVHIWFYLISTPQVKACTHMNDIRVFNCFRYIVAWYAMGFRGLQIPSLHLSINDWNHAKNYNHWRFLHTLMLGTV